MLILTKLVDIKTSNNKALYPSLDDTGRETAASYTLRRSATCDGAHPNISNLRLHGARLTYMTSQENAIRTLSLTHTRTWCVTQDKRWRINATHTIFYHKNRHL
jgi:hypothetical protein